MSEADFATRVDDALARVRRLEDIAEIQALHRSYVRGLADRAWDTMLDDFTDDAIVSLRDHGVRRGRAQLAELFAAMHAAGSPPDAYLLTSPAIELEGDTAVGAWTWQRHFSELPVMGGGMRIAGPWWEGRYNTAYRRVDGRWKFSEMIFRLVAPTRDADADRALNADLGIPEGER